jgi:hypothetical protein
MLSFRTTESEPLQIEVELTQPTVYLDHSVISDLATQKLTVGERLCELLLTTGGTLYLSWAHLVELFGLGGGPTFDKIAGYLKSFGPYFVITDADSDAVIRREQQWVPGREDPSLDQDFIHVIGRNWDGRTEMSVGILLDAMASEDGLFQGIKALQVKHRSELKTLFDAQRQHYRSDGHVKSTLDTVKYTYVPPGFVTNKVRLELARECVRTNDHFTLSDGLDFEHAVVSVSYCTHVVLDKKWARRCRAVDLPNQSATVFDGTQIDRLLAALLSLCHTKEMDRK